MQKIKFKIDGLKCSSCAMLIEDRLKIKPGIIKIKVDQDSRKGVAVYDEQEITEGDIYQTIEDIDNDFKLEKIEITEGKPNTANSESESNLSAAEFSNIACPFCKKHFSLKLHGEVVLNK